MALAPDSELQTLAQVAQNPRYLQLVKERSRFSWTLTGIMLVIFFGYILMIAFAPQILARPISGTITLGIPLGIGVILAGILLTGIYVHRANSRYDPMIAQIVRESGR
ncbi:MAG: DUF485 domain-containing protein [Pseudomonadota bacterium]|nr:DUF485 domain-containing protein [Sphingomonas sp.]MDQ3482444.1 DUF485 domain-containing protein [Pseudomonadota bacterium]